MQSLAGALPPRFQGSERNPCNFSNFRERIALDIVQLDDQLMVVAEPLQCGENTVYGEFALGEVLGRGVGGRCLVGVGRNSRVVHERQPARLVAPQVVDELVVHDPTDPRGDRFDLGQAVPLGMQLQQDILHEILCILAMPGQPIGEPVHPVQVRTDERRE